MRFLMVVAVAVGALFFQNDNPSPQRQAGQQSCTVSANYAEAADENLFVLLKLLSMANLPDSPLDEADTAGLYFTTLLSMRHYHEDIRGDLPACARPVNVALIETISASQDVIGMKLAQMGNPDTKRYTFRVQQTIEHLNAEWQTLAQVTAANPLEAAE